MRTTTRLFFAIRSDARRLPVQAFFDDGFHRPQKNIFTFFYTPYNKRGNEPLNLQY